MPVIQKFINFNEMFAKLRESPIILNDLIVIDDEEKEKIKNLIISKYTSDMMSILPACQCGETKGEYSLGIICNKCNTPVKSIIMDEIEPILWFRRPKEVAPLISPMMWILLSNFFTKSGFNVLQWIVDTTYRPVVRQPKVIEKLIESNMVRGYNNFVENFDSIMEYLFSVRDFTATKIENIINLKRVIKENRHLIFSEYLPLPNKSILIIEKTNVGIYIDPIIIKAIDAIEMVMSIDSSIEDHSVRTKENRTIKAIIKLSDFYNDFFKRNIAGKKGQFRKHVFGSRTNFNFRAVITSITDPHNYDEIYVPWSVGMTAFRPHLINKLLRLGYALNSAIGMLLGHVEKYNPVLDGLLQELIYESKDKGIYVLEGRNPTITSGSIQLKKITKFKTDPGDHTVSTSILTTTAPNSDFDGK